MITSEKNNGERNGQIVGAKYVTKINVHSIQDCINKVDITKGPSDYITTIGFHTKRGQHFGPYGTSSGETQTMDFQEGCLSGFHGTYSNLINSVGTYYDTLKPNNRTLQIPTRRSSKVTYAHATVANISAAAVAQTSSAPNASANNESLIFFGN